jgi:dynein heavy chain
MDVDQKTLKAIEN